MAAKQKPAKGSSVPVAADKPIKEEPKKAQSRPIYEPVKAAKKAFVMSTIEDIEAYAAAAKKNKLAAKE